MGEETFDMDMSKEKTSKRRKLVPAGWRDLTIVSGRSENSKQGNKMVILEIKDDLTEIINDEYFVIEAGKRWKFKALLDALGVKGGEDGNYKFSMNDIVDKKVGGFSEHEPNEWIDRNNEKQTSTQHNFNEFRMISWDG